MRQIQDELKRLNKLITDVSNASRLDAELAFEETEPVDLRDVLQGVFAGVPGHPEHRHAQLVLDIAEYAGPPGRLRGAGA